MILEDVPVGRALGTVLAHSRRLGSGDVLKKGRVLTDADCARLSAAGVVRVTVARLEPGDVGEDEAAGRVAAAAAGPHVLVARPATGRSNLFASARGLLVVSRPHVDEVNLVDEAVTIATRQPLSIVEPGDMVATVKIVPFAVPDAVVARACERALARPPLVAVAPFRPKRAALVLTALPGSGDEQLARAARNQRARVARLGGELIAEVRVDHDPASVAVALEAVLGQGAHVVLVLGASAIVDRRDVIPAAIEAVGGAVDHLGMPVDPGNLLLLAHKGRVPIVGVPGCARSLRPSGFDWILERLFADVHVGREEIMRMGAGGLLEERAAPGEAPRAGEPARADGEAAAAEEDAGARDARR